MPRYKSWEKFYENNWLVPLYQGSKYVIYIPKPELPDPLKLSREFRTEADYLIRKPTNDWVLHTWKDFGYNIGCLTGRQRDGRILFVQDLDLNKKFGSIEAARAWRRAHISELRDLETRVTFTPSGGVHVWNYASNQRTIDLFMEGKSEAHGIDWIGLRELVRCSGGMVAVPPSVSAGVGEYFFLDGGKQPIRELAPEEKPRPKQKPDDFMGEFLDLFDSKRGGIQS